MVNSVVQILELVAAGVVGLGILYFLLRRPEVSFALFTFAYVLKGGDLIQGPLNPTAILLVIATLGFFIPVFMRKRTHFKLATSDFWLWGFVSLLLAGCYVSPTLQGGFVKVGRFIAIVFLPYMLVRIFLTDRERIQRFLTTLFVLATFMGIILTILSFSRGYTGGRIEFFKVNEIPMTTLLVVGLIIAVIGAIEGNLFINWKFRGLVSAAIVLLLLYSIFLTGTRGPLISAVIGLLFYLTLVSKRRLKLAIAALFIVAFIGILLAQNFNLTQLYFLKGIPNIALYSIEQVTRGMSTRQRLNAYSLALTLFKQRPLLGIGTGGFPGGYPHNIFLEIASESGLIGLVVFICFLSAIARRGFRYFVSYFPKLDKQAKAIGLIVLSLSLTLFIEKQFSYGLDMHKDLFAFLGLVMNLPLVACFGLRTSAALGKKVP